VSRSAKVWVLYAACISAAAAGLAGVTWSALAAERAGLEANRQAALEAATRVALYRMDSQAAALIGAEAARPFTDYLGRISTPGSPAPVLMNGRHVHLHFELRGRDGLAVEDAALPFLPVFQKHLPNETLIQAAIAAEKEVSKYTPVRSPTPSRLITQDDWQNRATSNTAMLQNTQVQQQALAAPEMRVGPMVPVWCKGELLLTRRGIKGAEDILQGCWLDWNSLRMELERSVSDLLPGARIVPIAADSKAGISDGRRLAALPAYLVPGPLPASPQETPGPLRMTLWIAWVCGALAAAAVGGLLGAALALSERRATFVSAVTHEMRTPLTTFRLYADLLAEGSITEEAKRRRYYETLRAEAVRLGHLVENVLAYARIERRKRPRVLDSICVGEALDHLLESLVQRAAQSGRELTLEGDEVALSVHVRIDVAAFERILMNLVDNACKHGVPAKDPLIHIRVAREERRLAIRVIDSGPGVPKEAAGRMFRAFGRSAREAAGAAPGIGLGLALSHRLARRMRGKLRLERDYREGACFVLKLPTR
jgi:signal transduction histidine kinase